MDANGSNDQSVAEAVPVRDSVERNPRYTSLTDFARKANATRLIQKILIANNGIAAVKCMRSLRKWAYATCGDADALSFICMATPEDMQANAEYIKMANKTVMVPGGSNPNNYANVELILQTALTNEVDAVWAGWGHASENPQLPDVLSKHNITFLGPSHYAMWALGDKVASTILAQSANVPTLPWSGSAIRLPSSPNEKSTPNSSPSSESPRSRNSSNKNAQFYLDVPGACTVPPRISEELYRQACVTDVASCQACADKIGYPVMIKAAEGGGGKGIRRVSNPADVARYFTQVQSEVPDSPIFVMKCAQNCRHLEVQLLADQYGQAISLFGRDCSVQRRHQKIIEEAPIVIAPKHTVEAMERAAVRLAKLVGYVSAGTVEYLYDPCTDQFYFLELNPRLQVEHPCTEVIAEVNLPACQLQVAMGIPLHRMKDIRDLYRLSAFPSTDGSLISFDTLEKQRRPPSCYVIAARITSEDPDEGFRPRPGDVQELNFKSSRSVWGYFSVGSAGGIHEFADSQFGHCFSAAESREQARENLVLALKELSIRGDFRTTVEYLIKIMESVEFVNHRIDTDWLDRRIAEKDQVEKPDLLLGVVCTALHIADRSLRQLTRNHELHLERGQFLPSNTLTNRVDVKLVSGNTKFEVKVFRTGPSTFHLVSNGSLLSVEAHRMSSDGLLVCHRLASYMTYCHDDANVYRTVINNRTMVFSKENDPSVLRSQSTGKLLQYTVSDGAHVQQNEVFALIEVMKLVLELRVPASGVISLKRIPGCTLEPGSELACLKLDDPSQVQSTQLYTGPLTLSCSVRSNATPERRETGPHDTEEATDNGANFFDFSHSDSYERRATVADISLTASSNSDHPPTSAPALASNGIHRHTPMRSHSSTSSLFRLNFEKMHRDFYQVFTSFEQVLLGYALPEPFLTPWLNENLERLISFLHDPHLPLAELQDTIAHLAGRLPSYLERELRAEAKQYAGQVTSVMANFPSLQILRLVEHHLARLQRSNNSSDSELTKFQQTVQPLVQLAKRYRQGLRGHAIGVLSQLLLGYVVVEKHFQHGQYDKCTRHLLAGCNSSAVSAEEESAEDLFPCSDYLSEVEAHPSAQISAESVSPALQNLLTPRTVADVVTVIFSHRQLTVKNAFIIRLIEILSERGELSAARDLKDSLKVLTELRAEGNAKVALSARKLLIAIQTPSYEVRRNQAESIFLSAVDSYGNQYHPENLHKLITSETVVFDILTDFFYHSNPTVASAALEVYVRRAYTAYELMSIQHVQLSNGLFFLPFRFTLPTTQCLTNEQCYPQTSAQKSLDGGPVHQVDKLKLSTVSSRPRLLSTSDRPSDSQSTPMLHIPSVASDGSATHSQYPISPVMHDRVGGIAAFDTFQEFEKSFDELIQLFGEASAASMPMHNTTSESSLLNYGRLSLAETTTPDSNQQDPFPSSLRFPAMVAFQDPPYQSSTMAEEPVHTLNIALRHSAEWSENCELFEAYSTEKNWPKRGSDTSLRSNYQAARNARTESDDVARLQAFCSGHAVQLRSVGVRRITFLIVKTREFPRYYTFRARDNYREDRIYRHLEPALAFQLELNRLRNYELEQMPTLNRRMHLYLAKSKVPIGRSSLDYRFFVRSVIRHADLLSAEASFEFLQSEAEKTLLEALDALELAYTHPDAVHTMGNHIFLDFAPTLSLEDMNQLKTTIRKTVLRYARRFIRMRVTQAELKLRIQLKSCDHPIPIRVTLADEQGYALGLNVYREVLHPSTDEILLWSFDSTRGPLHGLPALLPYENKGYLQLKRFQARKFNTTYVYDYPKLITQALNGLWCVYTTTTSNDERQQDVVISCTELALNNDCELQPVERPPGSNTIGMVAWHMVIRTPDAPTGRAMIVIANDATHLAGSFGPAEDLTFYRASQLARRLGVPRIYLASNTGARIRVAEEVKAVFRVAWIDPMHPEKGYEYLYLSPEDYQRLNASEAVKCEQIEVGDELRYKITDIIGCDYDMSVENLRGSAMIAGETSTAYDDIFTVTIVTNRAIGIGAYLARLGQRIIQVRNSHIILTGAMALNKLLGREVYTSNSQLGGVQVMANNGVSHLVASDELLALQQALEWLTYIPAKHNHSIPVMFRPTPSTALHNTLRRPNLRPIATGVKLPYDPIDRTVDYIPSRDRTGDDPRWMFTGVMLSQLPPSNEASTNPKRPPTSSWHENQLSESEQDHWLSGFFDWGTWREALAAWAAGVVVGRARLGGIPCGAITAETRSVTCRVPADPANLSSEAQVVNQAGQVWYPDSAYKTAQAMKDMARERLPLFVFANWRGFSGGMKDMYDQVLKFGSMIIDAIRRYPEPVFVYLPPQSQLRGGAWVVVDPALNPDMMELYADPVSCRAGVLEPEGTVEIKYRKQDLLKTMHRLDEKCRVLTEELERLQANSGTESETKDRIYQLQTALDTRQKELLPFYHQVACTFADLHDTPARMESRNLVHGLIPWTQSRSFFYARLRRRLLEVRAVRLINSACNPCADQMDDQTAQLISQVNRPWKLVVNGDHHASHRECTMAINNTEASCTQQAGDTSQSSTTSLVSEISKRVPALGVQYSPTFARAIAQLRQWFILDTIPRPNSTTQSSLDPQVVWNGDNIAVGTWLAQHLGYEELLRVPETCNVQAEFRVTDSAYAGRPSPEFQAKIDELQCTGAFKQLYSFIKRSPDVTGRLSLLLHEALTEDQRSRLIHLLKHTEDGELDC